MQIRTNTFTWTYAIEDASVPTDPFSREIFGCSVLIPLHVCPFHIQLWGHCSPRDEVGYRIKLLSTLIGSSRDQSTVIEKVENEQLYRL